MKLAGGDTSERGSLLLVRPNPSLAPAAADEGGASQSVSPSGPTRLRRMLHRQYAMCATSQKPSPNTVTPRRKADASCRQEL